MKGFGTGFVMFYREGEVAKASIYRMERVSSDSKAERLLL